MAGDHVSKVCWTDRYKPQTVIIQLITNVGVYEIRHGKPHSYHEHAENVVWQLLSVTYIGVANSKIEPWILPLGLTLANNQVCVGQIPHAVSGMWQSRKLKYLFIKCRAMHAWQWWKRGVCFFKQKVSLAVTCNPFCSSGVTVGLTPLHPTLQN